MSKINAPEAKPKSKLSKAQIDAIERRHAMRQTLLVAFLRWHKTGFLDQLLKFFENVQQDLDQRQAIENSKAIKEGRKPRMVNRKLSSCAYTPDVCRALYINVSPLQFLRDDFPRLSSPQGYYIATPAIEPQLNENFTFQIYHADGICNLSAIHAWLLRTADERKDSRTLKNFNYHCTIAELFAEIKLPEDSTLISVRGLYFTDIYATKNFDAIRNRFPQLAQVVAHKMARHGIGEIPQDDG